LNQARDNVAQSSTLPYRRFAIGKTFKDGSVGLSRIAEFNFAIRQIENLLYSANVSLQTIPLPEFRARCRNCAHGLYSAGNFFRDFNEPVV
jgi:hypothetical protein